MSDNEIMTDKPKVAKSHTDLQRFKIEKLMKNPVSKEIFRKASCENVVN